MRGPPPRDNVNVSMLMILLVGLSVMALFAVVLRWASSLDTDKAHRKDYGLLREVAKVPTSTAARVRRTTSDRAWRPVASRRPDHHTASTAPNQYGKRNSASRPLRQCQRSRQTARADAVKMTSTLVVYAPRCSSTLAW